MSGILALDFATITGWAYRGTSGQLSSGTWDFRILKDESSGMRLLRFEAKLHEILRTPSPHIIAFEAVSVAQGKKANFDAAKLQSKMQAVIERLVELTDGVECCSRNLQTIKSHALRSGGKRDKAAMLAAAQRQWPDQNVTDDNQADALWLLDLVESKLGLGGRGGDDGS